MRARLRDKLFNKRQGFPLRAAFPRKFDGGEEKPNLHFRRFRCSTPAEKSGNRGKRETYVALFIRLHYCGAMQFSLNVNCASLHFSKYLFILQFGFKTKLNTISFQYFC